MIFDTHMHTGFSTDAKMTIQEAVAKSQQLGIGIAITEHLDLDYPTPHAFVFDLEEYFNTYQPFRSNSALLGIEIGMRSDLVAENRAVVEKYPLDFVIGSVHVIDKIDIYQEEFYQGRSKREVYGHYFEAMLVCLSDYDFIDTLGHIDYICRYARFPDTQLRYNEFADYIDAVLTILVEQEKALEINTRRLGFQETVEELLPIYRRFSELGGRYVTIGSDAHVPQDIGKHFTVAMDMAAVCGLKPVWYEARQPRLILP